MITSYLLNNTLRKHTQQNKQTADSQLGQSTCALQSFRTSFPVTQQCNDNSLSLTATLLRYKHPFKT